MERQLLHIGTCSWKYDSWQGIVYRNGKPVNYLEEYARQFGCVEVDQWFWSLFAGDKAVLPKPSVVREYAESVPDSFRFGIKIPNSVTLTHHYRKKKTDLLVENPHFLSVELMDRFLECIEPLMTRLGPLIFQFEYLNKQKMPGGARQFTDLFGEFAARLPEGLPYFVESRNPNFLGEEYFKFLHDAGLHHVFLHGYYMPSVFDLYKRIKGLLLDRTVIRLHGPDRKSIEQATGNDWSRVVAPKDDDIRSLVSMLEDLQADKLETFVFVNNHFEGSAPGTIARICEVLPGGPRPENSPG